MNHYKQLRKQRKPLIVVGIPTRGYFSLPFVQNSYRPLLAVQFGAINKPYDMEIVLHTGFSVSKARNAIVSHALERDAAFLLWLDDDLVCQGDILAAVNKLLAANVDIVCGLYRLKDSDEKPLLACALDTAGNDAIIKALYKGEEQVLPIAWAGSGFTLVNTNVYRKLSKPWYRFSDDDSPLEGEDLYFCRIAREAGYQIHCHTGIMLDHLTRPGELMLNCRNGSYQTPPR